MIGDVNMFFHEPEEEGGLRDAECEVMIAETAYRCVLEGCVVLFIRTLIWFELTGGRDSPWRPFLCCMSHPSSLGNSLAQPNPHYLQQVSATRPPPLLALPFPSHPTSSPRSPPPMAPLARSLSAWASESSRRRRCGRNGSCGSVSTTWKRRRRAGGTPRLNGRRRARRC